MNTKTVYELTAEDFQKAIEKTLNGIVTDSIFSKFEGREIDSKAACQILGVNQRTLYRYIGSGLITPIDHKAKSEYKFNLRLILESEIKKHKQIKSYK